MTAENTLGGRNETLVEQQPPAERPQRSSLRLPRVFCKQVLTENAQKQPREDRS